MIVLLGKVEGKSKGRGKVEGRGRGKSSMYLHPLYEEEVVSDSHCGLNSLINLENVFGKIIDDVNDILFRLIFFQMVLQRSSDNYSPLTRHTGTDQNSKCLSLVTDLAQHSPGVPGEERLHRLGGGALGPAGRGGPAVSCPVSSAQSVI